MSGESTTAVHRSQVDLLDFVDWSGVECLNQNSSHSVANALKQGYREDEGLHLESAADEQLLLYIPFTQVIELHSLLIRGPDEEGPRTVKLFANKEHMGFSNVNDYPPSDSLVLFSEHLKGKPAVLKFVKFQNVRSLTIFIEDNQSGADITKVQKISLYGTILYINKHKRSKRKSVDSSEISACLWSLSEVMHARNAIALRHVNLLSDPIHAERERARTETEEYKRSLNLMRRLPGYDVKKEMYTSGLSLFLNDHNRRMWLTLEDDVDYAEKWLKGLWDEKNSSG